MQVFSSRAGKAVSGFCRVDIGISGFLSGVPEAVTPAIVFEVILEVTVEVVQGSQVYSGVHWGHRGPLKYWQDPWRFLSKCQGETDSSCGARQECGILFEE